MDGDQRKNGQCTTSNRKILQQDAGKSWPQILAILVVCLGPFTNGILFAWSSPFSLVITKDKINYDITEADTSLFQLFQPLGMVLSSYFFFQLSELLGRKKSVLFVSVPHICCWIITIFARTKWEFYAARFVAGIGDAAFFCGVPPYVGEISTPAVRGFWGNIPTFNLYFGQLFITVIGSYFSVQVSAYICIWIPILNVILVSFLPESPYQLIKDGKMDEAKQSIQWLQRKNDVEQEFLQTKADVERQISERGTWMDLIKITSNRRALRAGVFLRLSQQFCGISTFASYSQPIFEKAGGSLSPQHSSMIFAALVCVLNIVCSISVEKYGRKPSYFYSLVSSALILLFMAIYFFLDQFKLANLDQLDWFPLAGMLGFVFTYSFGLGVVPTLMLGELFSASIKSKGLGVLMIPFGVGVLLSTNLFHQLTFYVGLYSPFLLYSVCCFISTFLSLKWVPETKGKTLEEIQQSLKK